MEKTVKLYAVLECCYLKEFHLLSTKMQT